MSESFSSGHDGSLRDGVRPASPAPSLPPEEAYSLLFATHPHPMWFYDMDTLAFIDVNAAAVNHYGYSRDEFLRMTIADIRPPEDVPALLEAVAATSPEQRTYRAPWRHRKQDGTLIHVRITSQPMPYDGRRAELVFAQDVTAEHGMQESLREAEARYRTLIESAFEGVVIHERGVILDVNHGAARMFGAASAAEMRGTHVTDYAPPAERESLMRGVLAGIETIYETKGLRCDGSTFDLEVVGKPHSYFGRQVRVAALRDVTARRDLDRRLRHSEQLFRALTENAFDCITIVDSRGRILYESPAVTQMSGYTPDELMGTNIAEYVHEDDLVALRTAFSYKLRHPGEVVSFGFRLRHKDGTLRDIEGAGVNLLHHPAVCGVVVNSRDVTEQRRTEEQLRQSQKMEAVGRLAGGVAHDFNNLLTAVSGYSDLLLRRPGLDAAARNHVEQIRRAAERAASLTQQLLAFSRKQMLRSSVLDLNAVVRGVGEMLARLIGEDIRFTTRFAPDLGRVAADESQIEQVIVNLVVNARDAMPAGGELTIETGDVELTKTSTPPVAEPGAYVCLAVADTGTGIDDATRRRIFEPFFTTKEQGKGTGLGLSTVYGIVKQSGGYILVDSQPGRGTTFRVYLPRVAADTAAAATVAAAAPPVRGAETPCAGIILLVEDDDMVRRVAREVLAGHGYTVLEAVDGESALALCRAREARVDLLLTDVVMPGMSGARLAAEARRVCPEIKVLFMSGYTDDEVLRRGVRDEEVAFIGKPWTPAALLASARAALASPAASSADPV